MKYILMLAALAIVNPAFVLADGAAASSAPPMPTPPILTAEQKALHDAAMEKRRKHREKLAAMSPEERAALAQKRKAEKAARKAARRKELADALVAAKNACPDCYRVISKPSGGYIGLNKWDYELYLANGRKLDGEGRIVASKAKLEKLLNATNSSSGDARAVPARFSARYPRLLEHSARMRYAPHDGATHTFTRKRKAIQQ